jgi:hypothetical protein
MPSSFNYSPTPTAGSVTATASGKLSDGSKVVLNSDGTVSAVAAVPAAISNVVNSTVSPITPNFYNYINTLVGVFNPTDNRVVVFYNDNSNYYIYAISGVISGSTITFGTPVAVNSYNSNGLSNAVYDVTTNTCAVVGSYYGTATLVTVQTNPNTTTFSFTSSGYGSIGVTWVGGGGHTLGISAATGKIAYSWYDSSNAYNYIKVGNIQTAYPYSTWGSSVLVEASYGNSNFSGIVFNATGSQLIITSNWYYNNYPNARLYTVSGNTPTYQQFITLQGVDTYNNVAIVETGTADKYFAIYRRADNGFMWGIVITVSGNTMTVGTPLSVISDPYNSLKYLVYYPIGGDIYMVGGYGLGAKITVSGTTFTVSSFSALYGSYAVGFYNSVALQILQIAASSSTQFNFRADIGYSTNLTSSNFLGVSSANYGAGALATIQTVGSVDDAQSRLTTGSKYSVGVAGTLLPYTTDSPYAGLALSPTKLLIKG